MIPHVLPILALVAVLAACQPREPANPDIGFADAYSLDRSATLETVVDHGGRVLDADAVRTLAGIMGAAEFAAALVGTEGELSVRPDGAACVGGEDAGACRRIVADGMSYRLFDLDGQPTGRLLGSTG